MLKFAHLVRDLPGTRRHVVYRSHPKQRRLNITDVRELLNGTSASQFSAGLKKRFHVFESHTLETRRT